MSELFGATPASNVAGAIEINQAASDLSTGLSSALKPLLAMVEGEGISEAEERGLERQLGGLQDAAFTLASTIGTQIGEFSTVDKARVCRSALLDFCKANDEISPGDVESAPKLLAAASIALVHMIDVTKAGLSRLEGIAALDEIIGQTGEFQEKLHQFREGDSSLSEVADWVSPFRERVESFIDFDSLINQRLAAPAALVASAIDLRLKLAEFENDEFNGDNPCRYSLVSFQSELQIAKNATQVELSMQSAGTAEIGEIIGSQGLEGEAFGSFRSVSVEAAALGSPLTMASGGQ